MKGKKRIPFILTVFCIAILFQSVYAAENLNVSHSEVEEDSLFVYVQNPGEYENVKC